LPRVSKFSQHCPFCNKEIEYERYEEFEQHIAEHRFEVQQAIDSVREFGMQKTFAPYVCGVCNLEFDFDLSASEKVHAHTVWHIEESKKKNSADLKQELLETERRIFLKDPEVQERIAQFDQQFFGQAEGVVVVQKEIATTPKLVLNKSILENIQQDEPTPLLLRIKKFLVGHE
jgi:hypothetical protein